MHARWTFFSRPNIGQTADGATTDGEESEATEEFFSKSRILALGDIAAESGGTNLDRALPHPKMVASIVALLYVLCVYNSMCLRLLLLGKLGFAIPCLLVFNMLWGLTLWSFVSAHRAQPGTPPKQWHRFVESVGPRLPVQSSLAEWQPATVTYCRQCQATRPERTHHCKLCKTCILRMDHHCPWISNCIGFHNHKFFLLAMAYACSLCYVTLATCAPQLPRCCRLLLDSRVGHDNLLEDMVSTLSALASLTAIALAAVALFPLTVLVYRHVRLAVNNRTSIDANFDNMPNPFDQGSAIENLSEVFGACSLDWVLPVPPSRPLFDGVCFTPGALDSSRSSDSSDRLLDLDSHSASIESIWATRYQVRQSRSRSRTQSPKYQCDVYSSQSGKTCFD